MPMDRRRLQELREMSDEVLCGQQRYEDRSVILAALIFGDALERLATSINDVGLNIGRNILLRR